MKITAADITADVMHIVNTRGLIRAYVQATGDTTATPYVTYRAQDNGRGGLGAAWQVVDVTGQPTDPTERAWYNNYGRKTILVSGRADRATQLAVALAWYADRYGDDVPLVKTSQIRTPGDYVPARVMTWFKAARKAAIAAQMVGATSS